MWKRRFAAAPVRSSSTASMSKSARPFTGEIEMRATDGTTLGYARLDFHLVTLELEHVEVAAGDVDGDVVDRRGADRALEAAAVGMSVEDDVGPVLRDRRREPVAAEIRPDPLRL